MRHDLRADPYYLMGGLEQRLLTSEQRVQSLEEGQRAMRKDLDSLRAWATRLGLLAAVWALALASHLSGEQAADLLAALLKTALKL